MKNKKNMLVGLTAALLLSTFTACSRRNHYEEILESKKEAETLENDLEVNGNITGEGAADYQTPIMLQTGDTPFYEGKTLDDLLAIRRRTGKAGHYLFPNGYVYESFGENRRYFYNKLTGNISNWCSDPLCDGSECIWSGEDNIPFIVMIQYVSENYIYFMADENRDWQKADLGIFRCDLNRNNIEKLLDVPASDDGTSQDRIEVVYEKGNTIYFIKSIYQKGRSVSALHSLDVDTLEVRVISENVNISQIIVIHDTVYYTTRDKNHDWNKTNLDFSSPELCWENSTIVQYNDRYMIIQKRRQITRTLLDLQSGETTLLPDIYGSFFCISGDYLYYTRPLTEEEIEHDPLKDYYTFTWEEETISPLHHPIQKDANNKDGGRVYRISLQEEEKNEECVFKFVYKDVPVRISDFAMDGEVMYITFHNYERYRNYFNQEFNSDLDEYISEGLTCSHAIVDFQNGTVNIIDMPEG